MSAPPDPTTLMRSTLANPLTGQPLISPVPTSVKHDFIMSDQLTHMSAFQRNIPSLRVPDGLRGLIKSFCREVLREQPDDVVRFAVEYMEARLKERGSSVKGSTVGNSTLRMTTKDQELQSSKSIDSDQLTITDPRFRAGSPPSCAMSPIISQVMDSEPIEYPKSTEEEMTEEGKKESPISVDKP